MARAHSMTEGKALPLILKFSLPLLAGNIFQQMYNLVDAMIVGRSLGPNALGAVNASASVQFLVLGFCIGCTSGFAVPVAQKFGAKDEEKMRRYVHHSLILTAVIAVVLTLITALLTGQILHLLQTPKESFRDAYDYLFVIFLGIPFTLLYNLLSSILRAVGDSKTPFLFLVISTCLNVGLDLLCIMVFHLACMGAALATILAQAISGILCLFYMKIKYQMLFAKREEREFRPIYARKLMGMGFPMGFQFSITAIGSMVMQGANNSLGQLYVDAFGAAARLKQFAMSPFDALATGVSTFASQNYGAKKFDRVKEGILKGTIVGIGLGIFVGLVLIFFGRPLTMMFVSGKHTQVLKYASRYLACLGYFYWCIGILNVTRLAVQGLGFTNRAIFSGVTEMVARIFMSVFVVPHTGFWGICFTDQAAWISAVAYIIPTCIYCVKKIQETGVREDYQHAYQLEKK